MFRFFSSRIFMPAAILVLLVFCVAGCDEKKVEGAVVIKSKPEGAEIFANEKSRGVTPKEITGKPGKYLFRLEAPGYAPAWQVGPIEAGKTNELNFELTPIQAAVLIDSKPDGAAVKIGSRSYGNTPVVLNSLPTGEYVAKLSKPGFEELTLRFEVKDMRPQRLLAVFDSDLGKLQIKSDPAGAYVFIDGKSVGVTPYETDLKSGRYRVKVSRDGYGDKEVVLEVKTEKLTSFSADLTEMPVQVNVTTVPAGADIIINEKNYGKAPLKVNLIPGKYNLMASKDGFAAIKRVVDLVPGQNLNFDLNLKSYLGSIEMEASPAGVELYVDGKKYKELDRNKKLTIRDLGPGVHRLEFRHPKAQPESIAIKVQVRSGEVTFADSVNMWIPNVELKFKSGELLRGVIVRADEKTIYFSDKPGITVRYQKKDIEAIREIK